MSHQQKRKKDAASEELTGRQKKKVRMAEARSIPVQSSGAGSSSQTGPAKVVPMNSLKGLPSAIDVEKVVESRAFEIGAMQTAMKTARAASTTRAWQELPRALRRRAASHDVRRVPKRLRGRALAEMDALPPNKKKMPRRGKANQESRTESFLRRQKDKTWLETHIWHAKRMHMKNMWGYRLALKPTEKAYRPSHRASVQGAIIHDASYYSLVELRGSTDTIVGVLNSCCDPQGASPGTARFANGARTRETHIYEADSFPFGLIAPISIIWHPELETSNPKGKAKEITDRVVWLRYHPVAHQQVLTALQTSATRYLATRKAQGVEGVELQICDLKDQINAFEIMGPQSSQIIRGALSAVSGDSREEFKQFWSSLASLQTSGSVPRNTVVGFKVYDPRLRFPPKRAKSSSAEVTSNPHVFPSKILAQSDIWDEKIRLGLAKPRYTKQQLDERRSQKTVPGTPLDPQRKDDRVPVLLIQRSVEAPRSSPGQAIHGWLLIVPSGWGMAFWSSLVFTGARVAGQQERQTQSYEAGATYFPRDYPSSEACNEYAKELEEELQATWDRKPPAKRTNFGKKEVDDPFSANWERLLGIQSKEATGTGDGDLVPTQREPATTANNITPTITKPWILRGSKTGEIVEKLMSPLVSHDCLKDEIDKLRVGRSMERLPPSLLSGESMFNLALVNVKVKMCNRGMPDNLALIYALEEDEQTKALTSLGRKDSAADQSDEDEQFNAPASKESLIGRVTTGNFSLSLGKGYAVGAVPLAKYLQILKDQPNTGVSERATPPLVKIRNTNSDQYRLARLELMVEGDN